MCSLLIIVMPYTAALYICKLSLKSTHLFLSPNCSVHVQQIHIYNHVIFLNWCYPILFLIAHDCRDHLVFHFIFCSSSVCPVSYLSSRRRRSLKFSLFLYPNFWFILMNPILNYVIITQAKKRVVSIEKGRWKFWVLAEEVISWSPPSSPCQLLGWLG